MKNKNKLNNIFKLNQAVEIRQVLMALISREKDLIQAGESDNYDALQIVTRQLVNLNNSIVKGIEYIKTNGEETTPTPRKGSN